jgi:16S rRNA (cytosine967-C5)-methyltransferase
MPPSPLPLRDKDTPRGLALRLLLACQGGRTFIQESLNQVLSQVSLPPADRRLVTQLAYGVLRRRGTLDALLRPLSNRPVSRIEPVVWEILRLGAYQLALLTHIPAHAALNETVELAGAGASSARVKGFLNGILRSLSRLLTDDPAPGPGGDALPTEGGGYRKLARAALPDPASDPIKYLVAAFSLPAWLVNSWLERWGWDECLRLGFWFAGPAPLWLRCNTLRTNRAALREAFQQAGITATPGEHPQSLVLEEPAAIRSLPGYDEGWFAVQDESAMGVASALDPQPGWRVLDLCAAPGGKTTHLAELMRNQGSIIACDVADERLQTLTALCDRLGVSIVETRRLHPERNEEPPAGPFDAALVDVPCSNTGVLGRRPEVRWRLRAGDFRNLVPLQTRLLIQAVERVKAGGPVVYSTCSIEPEENGQVVRAVLRAFADLRLEAEEEQVPGRPADGGYWARLRRIEAG